MALCMFTPTDLQVVCRWRSALHGIVSVGVGATAIGL